MPTSPASPDDDSVPSDTQIFATLREFFGFDTLRAGQESVIRCLLEGRPALAVFPTGGGKSLCYQLPALLLDGLTLVISPLIALMKDQVDRLTASGVPAARLDSTLDAQAVRDLGDRLERGEIRLLYVAPERLASEWLLQHLRRSKPTLLALDEAHCISEWGHNFRPDYLKIAGFCRKMKISRVLALTATATPKVSASIRKHFRIAADDETRLTFHRPNLDLRITPVSPAERKPLLLDRLTEISGAAVVYVTRQETAEEVATWLTRHGVAARAYHAGLRSDTREEAQRSFMDGTTRVMVATIAFGMGIDKADIRAVFHYNLPKSLENHTQEIGRAGRDGLPARCEMLACGEDLTVLENFIHSDVPDETAMRSLLDRLLRQGHDFEVSIYDLSVSCDVRSTVVSTVIAYLELDGWLAPRGAPFHATYRLRLLQPLDRVLAGRRPAEAASIRKLLAAGKPGRTWITFDTAQLAADGHGNREKIVAILRGLEQAGDAVLEASGVRQAYQLKRPPDDIPAVANDFTLRFRKREETDLTRLHQVLALATHPGCLTDALTRHFGESLAAPCGHCDRCRGLPPIHIARPPSRTPTDEEWQMLHDLRRENHPALRGPRQLARFLCGMSSPASTRARLYRHDAYGLLAELSFSDVLTLTARNGA